MQYVNNPDTSRQYNHSHRRRRREGRKEAGSPDQFILCHCSPAESQLAMLRVRRSKPSQYSHKCNTGDKLDRLDQRLRIYMYDTGIVLV